MGLVSSCGVAEAQAVSSEGQMNCAPLRLLQFHSDECEFDEELIRQPLRLVIMVVSDWGEFDEFVGVHRGRWLLWG
jgi:hypothetical protein